MEQVNVYLKPLRAPRTNIKSWTHIVVYKPGLEPVKGSIFLYFNTEINEYDYGF